MSRSNQSSEVSCPRALENVSFTCKEKTPVDMSHSLSLDVVVSGCGV